MRAVTLVFDLDGTLVDTADDLVDALDSVLLAEGFGPADAADLRPHAGRGGRVLFERALAGVSQSRRPDDARLSDMIERFVAIYAAGMPGRSRLCPGAEAALARHGAAGRRLAVCTNKRTALATALLAGLGLGQTFAAVRGSDSFPRRKPDPMHLLGTIDAAGGDPGLAVMIGDTAADIDAARAARVPSIAVDFGLAHEPAAALGADALIRHFDELDDALLERLLERAR